MSTIFEINPCPSILAEGFNTYSPIALRKLFDGKKVSHILPFLPPEKDEKTHQLFIENRKRLSISGVQKKLTMVLDKNKLRLPGEQEQSQYILKPIPDDILKADQVPANEHLTMQLAEQVFKINTAANGLIFFQDGQPAYITRRFDVQKDKPKRAVEDFAALAGKTKETAGDDFKYEASCEELVEVLRKYVPAYAVEVMKLFRLIVFNYLVSNGDAHLKNYSLIETENGDFMLSPAYDLINSRIHVNDTEIAFRDGLFADGYNTESFKNNGFYAYDDFYELGIRMNIRPEMVKAELATFMSSEKKVNDLIQRSFLKEDIKKTYFDLYLSKLKAISYSFSRKI
jgi:serine/threonine-protein kinase HipA